MKRSWPATILAFVMALIGIVLTIGGAWLLILGGSPYYLIAGLALLASGLVPVPRPFARRLDLHRPVHPERHLGLRRIARQCLGDDPVAGCAAGAADRRAAGHADADAAPTPVEACGRRHRASACCSLPPASRSSARTAALPRAALPAQSSPGMTDPSGQPTGADWPAYGGTNAAWRFSPLTQINRVQRRQASQGVGSAHRRASDRPRLREALRDREHAAQGRQPALHLHRQERDPRARRGDRQAGVAGRPAGARTNGSRTRPRAAASLITRCPARPPGRCAPAGSSKARSIRA